MQSRTTRKFWRLFYDLPLLQFKKQQGEDDIYSARIGLQYRALAVVEKDSAVWYCVGSHSEYDRLV